MQYEIINAAQGSQAWLDARKDCFTASETQNMMGVGKYKTRQELLHEKATGLVKEVDPNTQRLFDRGHATEALARVIAEKMIGEELYPITAKLTVDGFPLLASLDGLTMDNKIAFEHKLLSESLKEQVLAKQLEPHYTAQLDQILLVTGADKVLFVTSDGTEENFYSMWYETTDEKKTALLNAWAQFAKDLENYEPTKVKENVVAEEVQSFPVPSIHVRGELVNCNLPSITPVFDKYLAETNTNLVTDQDFADGEANAKNCREAAKNLKLTAKAVIGQITEINEAVSTLELYASKFDAMGLKLEKAVKEQKETIKTNAILKAKQDFFARVQELEAEMKPIRLVVETPNFADAIKGLKTIDSMHARISQALTNGYLNADSVARDIRNKLEWFRSVVTEPLSLFSDLDNIIYKPMDDFKLVVETRIAQQKERDAKRDAELKAKIEAEKINEAKPEVIKSESATAQDQVDEASSSIEKKKRPTDEKIISVVALHYRVHESKAIEWLLDMDLTKASNDLLKEFAA